MLTFDSAAHAYYWNGRRLSNVTSIIAPLTDYSRIPADVLERARQEGQAVHAMVDADCRGTLVDIPEWMFGHYDAWTRFKRDSGAECIASEWRVYHRNLDYAGTLDWFGLLPRLRGSKGGAVVDVKRSFYAGPAIGLQTAAYMDAWNTEPVSATRAALRATERYALKLNANGTYNLEPFTDRDDHAAFLACLQQLRWRAKHYPKET